MRESSLLIVLFVACPLSALIGFAASRRLFGFRVRYWRILVSTTLGFLFGVAVQSLLSFVLSDQVAAEFGRIVASWAILAAVHRAVLHGPEGQRFSYLRCCLLVLVQLAGFAVAAAVSIFILAFFGSSTPTEKTPNQALEPTTTAVTIPADAGLAPAVVVAHL